MNKNDLEQEIETVAQIAVIPKVLELINKTTGMRFAAVARVTAQSWTALAVFDQLGFGLKPGDEVELTNTLCSEVRMYEKPIIIDDIASDETYNCHPIPRDFGFQSHISVPIYVGDSGFWGTLCSVDPEPNTLDNEKIRSLFSFLANLIGEQLETHMLLKANKKDLRNQLQISSDLEDVIQAHTADLKRKVRELARSNQELKDFSYVASHDLQEPLRKIQTYASMIAQGGGTVFSDRDKTYFNKIQDAVDRMRNLIQDLFAYSIVQTQATSFETVNLAEVVTEVIDNLSEEIAAKNAIVEVGSLCTIAVQRFQIIQLIQNLLGNSLKYCSPERAPHIKISSKTVKGVQHQHMDSDTTYCRLAISDNGIGFDAAYSAKIFEVFQRLHGKTEYSGTGIGLAIVRKIVENHNGFVSVKSEVGVGSEFLVYLPLK